MADTGISIAEHLDLIASLGARVGACGVRLEQADRAYEVRKARNALKVAEGALAKQKIRTLAILTGSRS